MHKVLEWSKPWLGDRNTYSAAAVSLLANESAKTTNYFYVKSTINYKQALKLKKKERDTNTNRDTENTTDPQLH